MPGGFSLTGGWDAPKPLEGQPDLEGEPTDALYRTLTAFKRQIKEKEITPKYRHQYQGAIENIQQELTHRGKLKAAMTTFRAGLPKAKDPSTAKRVESAISKLQDKLDKREGTERISIPASSTAQPSKYEIANDGVMARYTRADGYGQRGAGVIMRGKDGKFYAYKGKSVFEITPDEANARGEVPRQKMAYRSKSFDDKRAWLCGFAVAQKGGPGSGNWGHAGRKGQRGGSLPKATAMSLSTGATARARQQEAKAQVTRATPEKTTVEMEDKGKIVQFSEDQNVFATNLGAAFDGVPSNQAVRLTLTMEGRGERSGWGVYPKVGQRIQLALPGQDDPNKTEFYSVGTRGGSRGQLRYEETDRNDILAKQGRDPSTGYLFRRTQTGSTLPSVNVRAERDKLLTIQGQASTPKPGVTRAQLARFYKRAGAVDAAKNLRYRDGSTAYEQVMDAFEQGMTKLTTKPAGRIQLSNPDSGAGRLFQRTPTTNLIRTLLNMGEFAANY